MKLQLIKRPIIKEEVLKEFPQGTDFEEVIAEIKKYTTSSEYEIIIHMKED